MSPDAPNYPAVPVRRSLSEGGFEFGPPIVRSLDRSVMIEWLETNGLGDFACGTVAGPNTRRQHGLFTASATGTRRPMLLLAALDVVLERDNERFDLSCHQYVGARHPEGFRHCARFRGDPFPEWRYEVPGGALSCRVVMPRGKRCVISAWTLDAASSPAAWRLRVRPLCAFREVDALTMANADANMSLRREDCLSAIAPYPGCPEMFFHAGRAEVKAEGCWYYRFQHPWDVALGREGTEDLFSPCELTYSLAPGQGVALVAGTEKVTDDPERLEANERDRRAAVGLPDMGNDPTAHALARAAEAFVVRTADGHARILATYPEPMEDLRSALLALPGILLCTRKLEEAKSLLTWGMAALVGEGSAASRLCGAMDDTPLWLIRAGELYVDHSRDWDFLRDELSPGCEALAQRYIENRSPSGYRLAPDGLLTSGEDPQPLTWMNAKMEDWAVTPRAGKPVEVNALWHHALGLLARWAGRRGRAEQAERLASLRELCGRSFRHRFWNEAENCLFDVVDVPEGGASAPADAAIRPNQLFAVSLPSDLLERRQAAGVLSGVENRLLAPCGLRTLSLEDMAFRPRYAGGVVERAAARHQGAIHPWLIGAYVDAIFRVHGRTPRAYARAEVCLEPLLREHLREACVGQISELFHGASPHTPQGAFAHAPAVGEIIRAYAEIKGRMP